MKQKMGKVLAVVALVAGMWTAVLAGPVDDYKVIKNAHKPGISGTVTEAKWLKMEVKDSKSGKVKVRITIPVSMLDVISSWCPDGKLKVDDKTGMEIDLKQMVKELKKAGPLAIIEVEESNESVRIWIE